MKIKKMAAYLFMPLLFTLIGYGVIYFAFSPIISAGTSTIKTLVSDQKPMFDYVPESIFNPSSNGNSDTTSLNDIVIPSYGAHYGNLKISSVNLDADLYFGDDNESLNKGVGQYTGSFMPGFGKPILVAGHNHLYFKPLQHVEIDDIITVTTSYGVYEYQITAIEQHQNTDPNAYDLNQDKEQLILYTCYPFDVMRFTPTRFFVYADKISGTKILREGEGLS